VKPKSGVEAQNFGEVALVNVNGLVDEHFQGFGAFGDGTRSIVLNVTGMTRMTSFGVRQWLKGMDAIPKTVTDLYLLGCPTFFVDQLNMVLNFGGSAQIAVHHGMPVQSSIDYKLYKNNNERVSGLFDPVKYPGGLQWLGMAEFTALGQTLKDPDKTGTTKIQTGLAGDVNVRVVLDRTRFRFDASYRDLAFILHSVPSLPTYEDFPSVYKTSPDFFAAAGVDQNWSDFLTLGLVLGVEKPASLTSPAGIPGGGTGATGTSTAVIRNNNIDTIITILPAGKDVAAQYALKGTAKLSFGRIYTALLEVFYSYDPNQTKYQRVGCTSTQACPDQPFKYVFGDFKQLGINATLQAKF